jgi:uncharacterized SAM-binding protein YcdF (DUF218 family)
MSLASDQCRGALLQADTDAAIIIFGAAVRPDGTPSPTLRHRVDAAARFGRYFRKPLFIPTGAKGRYGDAEAVVMANQLQALGYVSDAIRPETTGTDTLSSVRAVRHMIGYPGDVPIFACTSAYHLPRCMLLLRLAGIRAGACPPPPVPAATSQALRWFWRLRETPAIPYDAFLMLCLRVTQRI